MKLIGVDVGGTFTDVVLTDPASGAAYFHKVPSTPQDPSKGVMKGIVELCRQTGVSPADISHVVHGTTVATNAALEHKGATAGLITTKGFRDILHIGRHQRPQHYSIMQDIPWQSRPLIRRRNRKVVTERLIPPSGAVLTPLNEHEVRQAADELVENGVSSIAICFLFSYLNPAHEMRARDIVEKAHPAVFVITSQEVSPQYREFERFTTAAMSAFIGPLVRDYINRLERSLRKADMGAELNVMSSNGGVATCEVISRNPALTLMSGLAAGIKAGAWLGSLTDKSNVINFDIGGTSADIGVITGGDFSMASARDRNVAGYPIMTPMIDLHTIGAGGGSVAYIDEGGVFNVGPESAGADPGPAAYGLGGIRPTVTDANLVLGRLDPDRFLGGEMPLKAEASHKVVGDLAKQLDVSKEAAAEGVIAVLNANMANAISTVTVQRGIDPRAYCLIASGGAGPLHGVEVARLLGMKDVMIPPHPGISSAIGLLTTDLRFDVIRSTLQRSDHFDFEAVNATVSEMKDHVSGQLKESAAGSKDISFSCHADLRYVGQGYELLIPLPDRKIKEQTLNSVLRAFHDAHFADYGHNFPEMPVEFVNLRVAGVKKLETIRQLPTYHGDSFEAARIKTAPVTFRLDGSLDVFETVFYQRDALPVDEQIPGPAILLQKDTTTVIPPDCQFVVDRNGIVNVTLN